MGKNMFGWSEECISAVKKKKEKMYFDVLSVYKSHCLQGVYNFLSHSLNRHALCPRHLHAALLANQRTGLVNKTGQRLSRFRVSELKLPKLRYVVVHETALALDVLSLHGEGVTYLIFPKPPLCLLYFTLILISCNWLHICFLWDSVCKQ